MKAIQKHCLPYPPISPIRAWQNGKTSSMLQLKVVLKNNILLNTGIPLSMVSQKANLY